MREQSVLEFEERLTDEMEKYCTVINEELLLKNALKIHFSLYLTFHQSIDSDYITKPAIVFNSESRIIYRTTDLEEMTKQVMAQFMEQVETFQNQGSGWVLRSLVKLELHTAEYRYV